MWGRRHCLYYSHELALSPQPGHSVLEGQPTPQPWHTAVLAHLAGTERSLAGVHLTSSPH